MANNVLITGIHGFCARHLVRRLNKEGWNIHGAGLRPEPPEIPGLNGYSRMDITNQSNIDATLRTIMPDMIFHLAGTTSGTISEINRVNFMGSLYLLEAVQKFVPEARVLLVGSAAEYGNAAAAEMPLTETQACKPFTAYGISKYATTLAALSYAKEHTMKVVIARPFNIVGAGIPASLVVGAVLARIKKTFQESSQTAIISVGNMDTERDFIAVEDAMDAYAALIKSNLWGEVFNVCSGQPYSIRNLLLSLAKNSERKIEFHETVSLMRATDVKKAYGSGEKARLCTGFTPQIPLETALQSAWESTIGKGDF